MQRRTSLMVLFLAPLLVTAQQAEKVDLNVIHKIKTAELGGGGGGFGGGGGAGGGRGGSQVMNIMYNLTDRYGPRLTNSPQFRAAGDWAVSYLKELGLSNVHLEKWATPENNKIPSWQVTGYSGAMVEPTYMPIIGVPVAWTAGTGGPVTGEAVLAIVQSQADMDKFRGKLKGKIVLSTANASGVAGALDLPFPTSPLARRYTDAELSDLVPELLPTGGGRGGRGGGRGGRAGAFGNMTPEEIQAFQAKLRSYMKDEGVLLTLQASGRGESGTLFGGGAQNRMDTTNLPQVSITAEHYNRIARLLEHNVPVKLSFDIKAEFDTSKTDSFNVIAEIPGSTKPNELVMVGGHFDSWHYGTGATDNAAGSAVAMEVMRILKSLNLKMDRTVRMGLWGGEEEGLLGSRAYVKEHFADPTVMKPTTEHDNFSSYFNIDNGTGRIRGIYLQGNEMARPIFETWFAALKDLTPGVITIRNTGGTDHLSYDGVGLPGFQFVQDPMDYDTRTHHSNMDVYDRIQQADMEQMAIIEAAFVYNAATRPDKFPRKELPPPQPAGRGGRGGGN
ncbi:MAG TPA: M20/M25/M40 family metallo-hydrolase [Bryobacteraceae bacterium]|nr:M20/M25/M40 family metallo-hydrolase [Bryobacteraceae bacterium]